MGKCLITGCEGFIGSHLAELLAEKGLEVFGIIYEDTLNLRYLNVGLICYAMV